MTENEKNYTITALTSGQSFASVSLALGVRLSEISAFAKTQGLKGKMGFASMDKETRVEVARRGGKMSSQNKDQMSANGKKGGAIMAARPGHMKHLAQLSAKAAVVRREAKIAALQKVERVAEFVLTDGDDV